jgi:hypothetical protein
MAARAYCGSSIRELPDGLHRCSAPIALASVRLLKSWLQRQRTEKAQQPRRSPDCNAGLNAIVEAHCSDILSLPFPTPDRYLSGSSVQECKL